MDLAANKKTLEQAGILFEPGLTAAEIDAIEKMYAFEFPPDLKSFLMFALPVNKGFINWRHASSETIKERLNWPYEGMRFDVEANTFWLKEWGDKPHDINEAFRILRKAIDEAPLLIPVAGHRYLPASPNEANNPVFSVYQSDIVYYGIDLQDYLENEFSYYFRGPNEFSSPRLDLPKHISFWTILAEDLY